MSLLYCSSLTSATPRIRRPERIVAGEEYELICRISRFYPNISDVFWTFDDHGDEDLDTQVEERQGTGEYFFSNPMNNYIQVFVFKPHVQLMKLNTYYKFQMQSDISFSVKHCFISSPTLLL